MSEKRFASGVRLELGLTDELMRFELSELSGGETRFDQTWSSLGLHSLQLLSSWDFRGKLDQVWW